MNYNLGHIRSFICAVTVFIGFSAMVIRAQTGEAILFGFTNSWKYNQTVSYDGSNWTARTFDDSALPSGRGVFGIEDAANVFVTSRTNTALTLGRSTYYFRTHFNFTSSITGVALTFSNIVDDGAVYYLNGVEIARLYMTNGQPVTYATYGTNHEATTFDVFTLSGPVVETNLVAGDNVLAVEVHQSGSGSSDIAFGLALSVAPSTLTFPPLKMPLTPPSFGYSIVSAFPGAGAVFGEPVVITSPRGETNRLFVVSKAGRILVITNLASPTISTFLDISSRTLNSGESGMLGLAFHPGYATNGNFFIFYTTSTSTSQGSGIHQRLSRFQVSTNNPNVAATNEVVLITQKDPASNHNGGDIHFGPDGLLYVSLGDGGVQYDGDRNSQIISSNFFSAILRLDVDVPFRITSLMPNVHPAITNNGTINYRIPFDNPFIGRTNYDGLPVNPATVRTEFYAIGFRNPWRFSFDSLTGDLYCGDVGQDNYEEVSIITSGGNYGWAYREGLHNGYRAGTPVEPLINPIHEYNHGSGGTAVIGGVVYRGTRLSQLVGAYVFGDNGSARIWLLRKDGTNVVAAQQISSLPGVSAFGTDPSNGDVLLANISGGSIHRLVYNTNASTGIALPATLAATGAFTNMSSLTNQTQPLTASPGLIPYVINTPFWSDNAHKTRWVLPSPQAPMTFRPEAPWSFPAGMAWVKHFDLEMTNGIPSSARRIETRILVRNYNGVHGVTYRWGNSLTNAALIADEGFDEAFTIRDGLNTRTQIWHYPTRTECVVCHTPVAGFALGFNTLQLNCPTDYGGGPVNQIAAYSQGGYFNLPVTNLNALRALAHGTNVAESLEWRVRSYLAANCAQCHQPGGLGLGFWNANISLPTSQAGLIDGPLNNSHGNTNNRVIAPGSLSNSVLLARISTRGPGQMPPLGSSVIDSNAVRLLSDWITTDLVTYQSFPAWQMAYFGATNSPNAAPGIDADEDGASNYDEYIAGTNPIARGDVWRVSIGRAGEQASVNFIQPANRAYEIQWATNIGASIIWNSQNSPGTGPGYPALPTNIAFEDSITNTPFKIYRVKLSAP